MSTFCIPESFQRSYRDFKSYPLNIIHQHLYAGALKAYVARLDTVEPEFLTKSEAEVLVPFRDLYPAGQGSEVGLNL